MTPEEKAKVEQVATLDGCTLSEAMRRVIRGTRFEPVSVIEIKMQNDAGRVRQDTLASVVP
jgi:hypothetical protein